jgi:hypothetical protein
MDEVSARLELPFLQAGQAGKELWHNEALALLDIATGACVQAAGVDAPPPTPSVGQAWIVGTAPTGAWAGRAGAIAGWTDGGWRFVPAAEGMTATIAGTGLVARRVGAAWTIGEVRATRVVIDGVPVVGSRRPAIPAPVGGGTADAEARATLGAVLATLRAHGLIAI